MSGLVPLTRHLQPLTLLGAAAVLVGGTNVLSTLLIVARTSPDVYAAYTVGLSILMLASNWSDAGLASTLQVLATQPGNDRRGLEQYKEVGLRYAKRIVPLGLSITVGLTGILFFQSQVFQAQGNFYLLAAFAVTGVVAARTGFWNALLYSSGNFKESSAVQAIPAVARVIFILIAIIVTGLNFGVLLMVTLLPAVLGWGLARFAWRRSILATPCGRAQESEAETDLRVRQFLKPTLMSVVFNSVSYNVTLLGTSFFTAGVPIAVYGIFLRLNQIISTFSGVLIPYKARQLRLGPSETSRKRKGVLFIGSGLVIYLAYSLLAMFAYQILGKYVRHYSLDYPFEFAIFLFYNGVGHVVVMLDAVLASFGCVSHRLLGSAMLGIINTALVPLLRPKSLLLMLTIDTASIFPTMLYYAWVFRRMKQGHTGDLRRTGECLN